MDCFFLRNGGQRGAQQGGPPERPVGKKSQAGARQAFGFLGKSPRQTPGRAEKRNPGPDFRDSWPFDKTDNVFFNDKGMVLQYNVYHIAPYAMGQPTLTIPYAELEGIVRGQYLPQR